MRLAELEPDFLKFESPNIFRGDAEFSDCDGLVFLCPLCFLANGGPAGTHSIICWKPHVPQTVYPIPGRWDHTGSGFDDLSLVAASSSIHLLGGGCGWHGYVQNGQVHTDLGPERVAQVRALYAAQRADYLTRHPPITPSGDTNMSEVTEEKTVIETDVKADAVKVESKLEKVITAVKADLGYLKTEVFAFIGGILHQKHVAGNPGQLPHEVYVPVPEKESANAPASTVVSASPVGPSPTEQVFTSTSTSTLTP